MNALVAPIGKAHAVRCDSRISVRQAAFIGQDDVESGGLTPTRTAPGQKLNG